MALGTAQVAIQGGPALPSKAAAKAVRLFENAKSGLPTDPCLVT